MSLTDGERPQKRTLPAGVWGGQHISFDASDKGVNIEYDCAHAKIDQAIVLDQNGHFSVSGTQFPEHGGPARRDEEETGYPVNFTGEVNDNTMTLKVENSATKESLGSFTLVHGAQPRLFKCR